MGSYKKALMAQERGRGNRDRGEIGPYQPGGGGCSGETRRPRLGLEA
jgi:hypothetical protein